MGVLEQLQQEAVSAALDVVLMSAETARKVLKLLSSLENDIVHEIVVANVTGVQMTAYRRARLDELLKEVKALSAKVYRSAQKMVDQDMMDAARKVGKQSVELLNGVFGVSIAKASLPPSFLEKLVGDTLIEGAPSDEWWKRQPSQLMQKFADQMRIGMAKGETIDQLIQRVRGVPARNGQMAKAGIMAVQKHQAAALVRTSMQTVTNQTRLEAWRQNSDIVKGVLWVATLDDRTTPICRFLDSKGWVWGDNGELVPEGHDTPFPGPTAHWGCRSTQIPWTKSWAELTAEAGGDTELAAKLDMVPETNRASMNGPVPKSLSYNDWLKSLPESQAKKALGSKANYELWKAGKLVATPDLAAAATTAGYHRNSWMTR